MNLKFTGNIWFWKGPAPFYFVTVPPPECEELRAISPTVTYGWGMIPVTAKIGKTAWTTALFPKDGSYIVPIKTRIRVAEELDEDDTVTIELEVG
ncbi:MAG: DUF1905 domain-containing protein [Litorilinea sp.]